MTNKEMQKQIEQSAQAELREGAVIVVNEGLPFVSILLSDGAEYFFQGQEADELLAEHKVSADKFDVTVKESILHSSQGW